MTNAPTFPRPGDPVPAHHASAETLALLSHRRSTVAKNMTGPGPSSDQVEALLRIASRTPDHGKLFPWRFMVFEGPARARFGEILESRLREIEPDGPEERYSLERSRFERAPVVVAVISDVTENHKIPEWEQVLSAGAVCQQMLIAASAMGFAAQWLTEWYAYDRVTKKALGLDTGERVAGFIYIGSAAEAPTERPRKAPRITRWGA